MSTDDKWRRDSDLNHLEENIGFQKEDENQVRRLSLQENSPNPSFDKIVGNYSNRIDDNVRLDRSGKLENNNFLSSNASLNEEDLSQNEKRQGRASNRSLGKKRIRAGTLTGGCKRRTKSLCRFEPNKYTIADIRKLQERLASGHTKTLEKKLFFFRNFTKKQKMVLFCLCLVEFTSFCSLSIMAPFFPKEAVMKGMSETTAGLVFSFYALVIFISSPFLGKALPKVGAKFLFTSGLFITSTCNFFFGLLGYIKQRWIFTLYCFLVQGMKALGASAYCTASYVFVAELFSSNVGSVLGIMETFVGLGMSIGPALGGFFYQVGGFGLPFYVLGAILVLLVPLILWLLPMVQSNSLEKRSGSLFKIIKQPTVLVIGLVIVMNSNIWAFLDPTLEPHLRQVCRTRVSYFCLATYNLTPEKIGLIFLLFSALYGLSSPVWGIVADKTNNHWFMMTCGLFFSTLGLLLLGPATFIPFLNKELWLNLVALAIVGISVSLSILPTFQGLITAIVQGGHGENDITTYAVVAGIWSSLYALGEVIGPLVGAYIAEHYGFDVCCTIIAGATFTLAVGSIVFFSGRDCLRERDKNCRYSSFDDYGDGDSDFTDSSDELTNQPLLLHGYNNQLYTEER